MSDSEQLTFVDLFCGAGGLSLGLTQSNWRCTGAVEHNADAAATHEKNLPGEVICSDATQVDLSRFAGADLVAGGPPCQPFSVAGPQQGTGDVRNMIPTFIEAVRTLRPRAFLMENVDSLARKKYRGYRRSVEIEMSEMGYLVRTRVLDAASFGVPQHRTRLFMVGILDGTDFYFPDPTHGPEADEDFVACGSVVDREPLGDPCGARIYYAKNPTLRASPHAGMLVNGRGLPLRLDAPSFTICASAGGNLTHIVDPDGVFTEYHAHLMDGGEPRRGEVEGVRRLTALESQILQGFPADWEFEGSKSSHYRQVGNAVPPPLARALGGQIRKALDGELPPPKFGGLLDTFLEA